MGITSPIVKIALTIRFIKGNKLKEWRTGLEQWIDSLNTDTDDILLV
jgi:hypothetical protein